MKLATNGVGRAVEHRPRRADLPDPAGLHHGHPVGHRQRLGLVVRDEDRGHTEGFAAASSGRSAPPGAVARRGSTAARRTGTRADARRSRGPAPTRCCWPPESCPGRRSSKSPRRQAVAGRLGARAVRSALADLLDTQRVGDVVAHRHVREQRVVLEHHRHVALARRPGRDVLAADAQRALGRRLQPGDRTQQRRLAAAGRAEQGEELAVGDRQVDAVDAPSRHRDTPSPGDEARRQPCLPRIGLGTPSALDPSLEAEAVSLVHEQVEHHDRDRVDQGERRDQRQGRLARPGRRSVYMSTDGSGTWRSGSLSRMSGTGSCPTPAPAHHTAITVATAGPDHRQHDVAQDLERATPRTRAPIPRTSAGSSR